MVNELGERLKLVWWAVLLTMFACLGLVLFCVLLTGVAVVLVSVGIPMLMVCFPLLRRFADFHRHWAGKWLGVTIPASYRPRPKGNPFVRLWATVRDPASWRDVLWLFVNGTFGLVLCIAAIVESVLGLLFWWWPKKGALYLDALLVKWLLSPSEKALLASRVQELAESRAETVDSQAAEIRRIERDLHDGAQARLVALGMNLGMAADAVDTDPQTARLLLAEAQAASSQALAELRGLVRGIHPPVLADRGLVGAVQALALATPLAIDVEADVPGRLAAPVESAAYFAVAEALTNVIKHSGAHHVGITLRHAHGVLHMVVEDDGRGGATIGAGSGLRGIERRLGAFDGSLKVTSPPGGPTSVIMELPCESSSPKTSPSSGTG
ncbi:MAG TPA: sensor domain-containing protein [Jatrophihabitantaceae bacterium]|jgi:signal transduction histidine kinase